MQKKIEYVMEHFSKEVRRSIVKMTNQVETEGEEKRIKGYTLKRKKQRVWTLNRSPHGNKTAREQFGRQVWQRRMERKDEAGLDRRKKIVYGKNEYVTRKEIQKIVEN
jgi:ribosomal protein S10